MTDHKHAGLTVHSGHASEQGLRPTMEDEVLINESFHIPSRGHFSFFAVFDGHGGRSAAIFARDHLYKHLHAALSSGLEPHAALTQAYLNTDANFMSACRGDSGNHASFQCDGSGAPSAVAHPAHAAPAPSLTLPPSDGVPQRRQQSANLAVKIPAASLPPVTGSVATARSASAVVSGAASSSLSPDLEKDTSGTTAVSVLLHHDSYTLYAANAGDSRAVLSTSSGAIVTLTNDHKADRADEVDRIRRAGGFVVHKRVMGELAISRAIGDADFKESGFAFVLPHPELAAQPLSQHDEFVLLACDGVFDVLSSEQACAFVREKLAGGATLDAAALALVRHAIDQLNSRDNVTCVLVQLPKPAELQAAGVARPDAPQLPANTCIQAQLHDSHIATPQPQTPANVASPAPTRSPFAAGPAAAPATPTAAAAAAAASPAAAAHPATPTAIATPVPPSPIHSLAVQSQQSHSHSPQLHPPPHVPSPHSHSEGSEGVGPGFHDEMDSEHEDGKHGHADGQRRKSDEKAQLSQTAPAAMH